MKRHPLLLCAALALVMAGCDTATHSSPAATASAKGADEDPSEIISAQMDEINVALAADGADYRVAMAEWITDGGSDEAGNEVLAKDLGNKRLSFDFVPGDERRTWSADGGTSITYAIDETIDATPFLGGISAAQTDAAIEAAMATWDDQTCSDLGLTRTPTFGADVGVIAFLFGLGGSQFVFADVQHAGFRDIDFVGGILGVAYTFRFIDDEGNSTDIDENGVFDAAFREIYYDASRIWGVDGAPGAIDVESIALHEAGHGLSQAHFGTVRIKNDGSLQRSPFAVMNALYAGPLRDLQGTDNGGHCSNWGSWPSR